MGRIRSMGSIRGAQIRDPRSGTFLLAGAKLPASVGMQTHLTHPSLVRHVHTSGLRGAPSFEEK